MRSERRSDRAMERRRGRALKRELRTGFTLVELLLALAISVIVAVALAESLFVAFHAKASVEEALEATRATDIAGDAMWEELANCLPPTPATTTTVRMGSGSGATPNTCIGPFVGTDTTVDFFTSGPEPKAELQSDVREVEYVLVSDPLGGQMLVRHVYTNVLPVVTPPPTPPDEVLCHGVVSFTLSYFDGANWVDAWDSVQQSDTLPVAVEVTLELSPRHGGGNTRLDRRIVPVACGTAASAAGGG